MGIKKSKDDIINFAEKYTGICLKEWQMALLRNHKKVMKNAQGRTL
jgi:hypothetical protein